MCNVTFLMSPVARKHTLMQADQQQPRSPRSIEPRPRAGVSLCGESPLLADCRSSRTSAFVTSGHHTQPPPFLHPPPLTLPLEPLPEDISVGRFTHSRADLVQRQMTPYLSFNKISVPSSKSVEGTNVGECSQNRLVLELFIDMFSKALLKPRREEIPPFPPL